MSKNSRQTGTSDMTATPTFGEDGKQLIELLRKGFSPDAAPSQANQYFLSTMQGAQNPYMQEQIDMIKNQTATGLPKELAVARSMTRGRPDTFGAQMSADVVGNSLANRDMALAQLLGNQHNIDTQNRMGAAGQLMSEENNQVSNQLGLLSLLRGEQQKQSTVGKTRSSVLGQALGALGAFLGN